MKLFFGTVFLAALALTLAQCRPVNSSNAGSATGAAPLAGDSFVFDSNRTGNYEVFTARLDGTGAHQITSNSAYDSWGARLSPNRQKILFYRSPAGVHNDDLAQASLWMMNADGTSSAQLLAVGANGWTWQGHAEWAPDNAKLVMFAGPQSATQIYTTEITGLSPVQIVSRAGVSNIDPAYSSDKSLVIFAACPSGGCGNSSLEIYKVSSTGGGVTRLTTDALEDREPIYSPSRASIAVLTNFNPAANSGYGAWGIRILNSDGTGSTTILNDGGIVARPQWSSDGTKIYMYRLGSNYYNIYRINIDGTGLTEVIPGSLSYNNENPSL